MPKRLVTACEYCRVRKVKCDKQIPCSTCKKRGKQCSTRRVVNSKAEGKRSHLHYDVELLKLKLKLLDEQANFVDTVVPAPNTKEDFDFINIYKDYTKVYIKGREGRNCFGPLSWTTLMNSDNALRSSWNYIEDHKMTELFGKLELGSTDSVKDFDTDHQRLAGLVVPSSPVFDSTIRLDSKLLSVLANQKVIWTLIRRFFRVVYPYVPFIDERDFRGEISRLIDDENFEVVPVVELNIRGHLDFATLGILLVILRLSYLSYFSNDLSHNLPDNINTNTVKNRELKFILENPISMSYIVLAQSCLDEFNIFNRSNVTVLQLALLLRTYRHLAPEEGDGPDGGDSIVLTSTLVSMATNLGLNREPDESITSKRECNLFRKLAIHLKNLDTTECVSFGTPSGVDRRYFDIKCPFYALDNSNLIDTENEREVISAYMNSGLIYKQLEETYNYAIDLSKPANARLLDLKLIELKDILMMDALEVMPQDYANSFKVKLFLLGEQLILSIQFLLHIHYERQSNYANSKVYIKETLRTISSLLPILHSIVEIQTDGMHIMSIAPILQTVFVKAFVIVVSVLIRTNVSIQNEVRGYSDMFSLLIMLSVAMKDWCVELLELFSIFSTRYYYFWRILRGCHGLLKLCFAKDFYEPLKNAADTHGLHFSNSDIHEILSICGHNLDGENSTQDLSTSIISAAGIPNVSSKYISDVDLNRFWVVLKSQSKSNATMKRFQNLTISEQSASVPEEEPEEYDFFTEFYNDFLRETG